ncbi:hypothetical protein FQZ97_1279110 [compost metagenome]
MRAASWRVAGMACSYNIITGLLDPRIRGEDGVECCPESSGKSVIPANAGQRLR